MSDGQLGLAEAVSIALGGMIGGGIYAVLGVVTGIASAATWLAFLLAGTVALCTGYSFVRLNHLAEDAGGAVTFVQAFVGNSTLAGVAGWTLLVGYVGSMAMYAFAFDEFSLAFGVVPEAVGGVPLRPVLSILVVGGFVGLNLLGARATGRAENVLVAAKVGVLVAFGLGGLLFGYLVATTPVRYGLGELGSAGPVMAAGVSFVAFQGWQLLFYDQGGIEDAETTIRRAVYLSIPAAVVIYVLVAVVTFNLAPEALVSHPHTALKEAASTVTTAVGLGGLGGFLIGLSALFSTGSAINATLFSTGYFAKGLLSMDLVPDRIGDAQAEGVPTRTVLVLGGVTAVASAYGSLGAITSFASIAFIVVFGATCVLAFRQRDQSAVNPIPPAIGAIGSIAFLPMMLYHLYRSSPNTFVSVAVVAVAVVGVELLYFERDALEAEIERFQPIEALE